MTSVEPDLGLGSGPRVVRRVVDGRALAARVWSTGDRPDVVLVHGLVVSSTYLVPTAERLARRLDVWALDLPGFGESDGAEVDPGPASLAAALAGWMDAVGLERAAILANSYGCQVATELAMRHPERVTRLALSSPTMDPTARTIPRQLARFRAEASTQSDELQAIVRREWRSVGPRRGLATLRAAIRDRIEDRLPYVEVPTVVVRGTADPMVPRPWAEEVVRLLPAGRLVELDGVPHAMVHDAPDELAEAVLPFLSEDGRAP